MYDTQSTERSQLYNATPVWFRNWINCSDDNEGLDEEDRTTWQDVLEQLEKNARLTVGQAQQIFAKRYVVLINDGDEYQQFYGADSYNDLQQIFQDHYEEREIYIYDSTLSKDIDYDVEEQIKYVATFSVRQEEEAYSSW